MRKTIIASIVLAALPAFGMVLEPAKGKTEFLAIGRPSALKIKGTGVGPTGSLVVSTKEAQTVLNGEVAVDLSSLDTGISLRDRHMKEKYLEVEKFKEAKLIFKDVAIPSDKIKSGGEVEVKALLELHGQTKEIPLAMTLENKDGVVKAETKFKIKLSEFSIAVPSYAGITVADEVNVTTVTEGKL